MNQPLLPSTSRSVTPLTGVTSSGTPVAAASYVTSENVSYEVGRTNASLAQ